MGKNSVRHTFTTQITLSNDLEMENNCRLNGDQLTLIIVSKLAQTKLKLRPKLLKSTLGHPFSSHEYIL